VPQYARIIALSQNIILNIIWSDDLMHHASIRETD